MAKKNEKEEKDPEALAAQKAEAVAEAVNRQAEEDARNQEKDAIKAGKDAELLGEQTWEEGAHDNPFEASIQARVEEVRTNPNGEKFVKFVAVHPNKPDVKNNFEYLPEAEFRARFPKLVK